MSRLNKNPLTEIVFNDFSGGYAGAKGASTLDINEAQDLDNIIILPGGNGYRNRQGNQDLDTNDFTNMNTKTTIVGMGTYKNSTAEYLIWATLDSGDNDIDVFEGVLGSGSSTLRHSVTGTFTQNDILTLFNFQGKVIGVGSHITPFKIVPASSGAALGGSPPAGTVGLAWNNVAWIGNTTSNPSKLYYSILNDPEDWSSSGSGFVEPQAGDGDEITALAPISNNILLLFKNRSIFQVVGRADPFAVFPLFQGVGCAGPRAIVATEGLVYFITPEGRMRITDGNRVYDDKDIPRLSNADDLWNQVPVTRLPYVQGFRQQGNSFDHIVWMVSLGSSQSTNNYAIVWDLKNKCWLKRSTGYNGNAWAKSSAGKIYIGTYTGAMVDQLDYDGKYTDDSEGTRTYDGNNKQIAPTDPKPYHWYWRSDDTALNSLENIVQVDRINVLTEYQGSGALKVTYGYDGYHDQDSKNVYVVPSTFTLATSILGVDLLGGFRSVTKNVRPLGRGNTFNIKIGGIDAVASKITKYTLSGRQAATKISGVR